MGTSFFAAAAMYFMVRGLRKDAQRSYPLYAQARFKRLIIPFAGWNVLYFFMRFVCDHWIERRPMISVTPAMLLLGYDNKLWFLPFIFVASLLAFPLARWALRSHPLGRAVVVLSIAIGVVFCLLPQPETYLPDSPLFTFVVRVIHVLPCTLWGVAIGISQDAEAEGRWANGKLPLIALVAIAVAVLGGWAWDATVFVRNVGGLGMMVLGLSLPNAKVPPIALKFAPKSFGIYLIHPLMLGCWVIVLRRIGIHESIAGDMGICVLTVGSTIMLLTFAQEFRWTQWLIPGESTPVKSRNAPVAVGSLRPVGLFRPFTRRAALSTP